jgi:hypothetical protein
MRRAGDGLVLSATDLTQFLCCPHGTALDMATALGERERPWREDPLLEILFQRGLEHERTYVKSLREEGKSIVDLSDLRDQVHQARLNIRHPRFSLPMAFGGEVNNVLGVKHAARLKNQHSPRLHLSALAGFCVISEIIRKCLFELQRDPFAHHPHAIDCIHKGLGLGFQQVAIR